MASQSGPQGRTAIPRMSRESWNCAGDHRNRWTMAARLRIVSRIWSGVVAVVFAAVMVVGCASSPRCPPGASCPPPAPPGVTFAPTINGHTVPARTGTHVPTYRIRSGESLAMRVRVTVPRHVQVTALWFGVSTGTWGNAPKGRPIGMKPILGHFHHLLSAGAHTFHLRWHVPEHRLARKLYLTFAWASRRPPATLSGAIVTLKLT